MQIITTAIIKGGTGKTTTAVALAQAAAASKKKVLLVDLDPQANATLYTGANQNLPGSYDLLHGKDPAALVQRVQGMDVISGCPDLAAEKTGPGSANRLKEALLPIRNKYSLIVIDTPPQMGEMTFNALQASTRLLIPLCADPGSLQGLYQIADIAHQIQRRNPDLKISGAVITNYDGRAKLSRAMRDGIQQAGQAAGAPLLMEIRAGISIREAQALQESLFEYAPKSKPAQDYMELYNKIMKRR